MDVAEDHFFLARALGVNHGHAIVRAREFCSPEHTLSPCHACAFRAVLLIAHERHRASTIAPTGYTFARGIKVDELGDEFRAHPRPSQTTDRRETLTSLRAGESYAEFSARAEAQGRQPDKAANWAAHAEVDEEGVLRTTSREGGGVFCVRVFAADAEFFRYGQLRFQPSILNARDEFMDTVEAAQLATDEGIAQIETVTLTWHRHEPTEPTLAPTVDRPVMVTKEQVGEVLDADPWISAAVRLLSLDDIRTPGEWRAHVLGQEPGAAWGVSVETNGDVEIVAMTPGPASFTSSEPDEDRRQANAEFIAFCGSGAVRRVAKAALDARAQGGFAAEDMDGLIISVDEAAAMAYRLLEDLKSASTKGRFDRLRQTTQPKSEET